MKTNIRSRNIDGSWNEPRKWISEHKSVVISGYFDQSSSAGDWNGYFVQKFGGKYGLFFFSQENNWPKGGFWLEIQPEAIRVSNTELTIDGVVDFLNDYLEL